MEQQQADMVDAGKSAGPRLSPAQQKINRQREGLLLARKRLADQMQASTRPEHRRLLERAIAEIEKQLSSFHKLNNQPARK